MKRNRKPAKPTQRRKPENKIEKLKKRIRSLETELLQRPVMEISDEQFDEDIAALLKTLESLPPSAFRREGLCPVCREIADNDPDPKKSFKEALDRSPLRS